MARRAPRPRTGRVHRRHPVPGDAELREAHSRHGGGLPRAVRRGERRRDCRSRGQDGVRRSGEARGQDRGAGQARVQREAGCDANCGRGEVRPEASRVEGGAGEGGAEVRGGQEEGTLHADGFVAMTGRSRTSQKVARFTESVIREMTRLAQRHGAVNLSQGFPDFPAPEAVKAAACEAIRADINQYAVTWGARPLREAIAEDVSRRHGLAVDPDRHVTVCCGATETMMATMMAIVDPGDEVIVFEPFYENYGPD